jgi:hypothetical protein
MENSLVRRSGVPWRRFPARNGWTAVLLGLTLAVIANAQTPIPQRQRWETAMLQDGARFCNQSAISAAIGSGGIVTFSNVWFYDGTRVYDQIAAYTGHSFWHTCAGYVKQAYGDWVLAVTSGVHWPVGALNGYSIFPHGLLLDYQRTGSSTSRDLLFRLAHYSAFAENGGDASCLASRETAYVINAYLAAQDAGDAPDPFLPTAVNYALGHIDQWFVSKTCADTMPFMVGLTMEALIGYYEHTGDTRIPPKIRLAADELWRSAWLPAGTAFYYESAGDNGAAPDLNLLIAPAYAWLWQKTGLAKYLDRGDQIFSGGVLYATLSSGKQFTQNYRSSFDYVRWRSAVPRSLAVSSTGFVFSRATGAFNGKLLVTNTGSQTVIGSLLVELMNLTPGVTLANATGISGGVPYIVVPGTGSLAPGQTAIVSVQFRDPSNAMITFSPVAY